MAVTLGVLLGLVAGYCQRWVDATVMRLADVTLAFPTLLLLIAIAAAVRPSLPPRRARERWWRTGNLVGDALREAFDPKLRSEK
ncbi:MAG: hypothetical protein ACREOC_19180 [Gemmatimonadales bacterium]